MILLIADGRRNGFSARATCFSGTTASRCTLLPAGPQATRACQQHANGSCQGSDEDRCEGQAHQGSGCEKPVKGPVAPSDVSNHRQGYLRARVKSREFNPALPWHRHKGQEFLYVLSGRLELHTELYEPLKLNAGDSILFDSSMGHHYVSLGRSDAEILISMSLEGYQNVSDTLRPIRAKP